MYKNNDGDIVSIDEAQSSANVLGVSVEEWAQQFGWEAEGKQAVPEETTPPTEPEKAETSAGESSSDDSLLESPGPSPTPKTPDALPGPYRAVEEPVLENTEQEPLETDPPKKPETSLEELELSLEGDAFIIVDGERIYKDNYENSINRNMSRGGVYSPSFAEYAEQMSAQIQYENLDALPSTLQMVKVTDKKKQPKLKGAVKFIKNKRNAKRYLKRIAEQNEFTNRDEIISTYFGLEVNDEGEYFIPNVSLPGAPMQFVQAGGVGEGTEKQDIRSFLGEQKYQQWVDLVGMQSTSATQEQLNRFNLDLVQDGTKSEVISRNKNLAAQAYIRNLGEDEAAQMIMFLESDTKFDELIRNEYYQRLQDEKDFEEKFNRPLVKKETIQGRTYIPSDVTRTRAGLAAQGFGDELNTAFGIFESDLKIANSQWELFGEHYEYLKNVSSRYNERLSEVEATLKMFDEGGEYAEMLKGGNYAAVDKYNATIAQYNAIIEEQEYKTLESNWERLVAIQKSLKESSDSLAEQLANFEDFTPANEALTKLYGFSDRALIAMEEAFIGAPVMLGGTIASWIGKLAPKETEWHQDLHALRGAAVDYNRRLQNNRQRLMPTNLSWGDWNKFEDVGFGQYGSQVFAEASPSILVTMTTMGAGTIFAGTGATAATIMRANKLAANLGMGMFFTMESGGYLSQTILAKEDADLNIINLKKELSGLNSAGYGDSEKARKIKEEIEFQKNYLKLSELKMGFNAVMYGGIAGYAERFSNLAFIKNMQRYSRSIGYGTFSKFLKPELALRASKSFAIPQMFLTGGTINLFEESVTLVGQNLLDIQVGGFKKSVADGLDAEFLSSTFATSLALSGPSISQKLYSSVASVFTSKKETQKMKELRDELLLIQADLSSDKLTPDQRKELRNKRRKTLQEMSMYNAGILTKLGDMDAADIDLLISLDRDLNAIYKEARELGEQGEVGAYGKKQLEKLKEQAIQLEANKEEIFGKSDAEILIKFKDSANPAQAQFNYGLFRTSLHFAKTMNGNNLAEIRSLEDLQTFFKGNEDLSAEDRSKIMQAFLGKQTNALEINGKIVVFSDFIEAQIATLDDLDASIAAVSPLHELGHIKTRQSGILKDVDIVEKANALVSEVRASLEQRLGAGEISQEDFDIAIGRLNFYEDNSDTQTANLDEAFQLVADLVNTGAITRNSMTSLYDLKSFVRETVDKLMPNTSWTLGLNSSDDIFNFVSSWTSKVAEGEQVVQPEVKEKTSISESRGKDLLSSINELVPESVQTQADFFDRKVFNPIYNDGKLHPAIANYIRSRSVSKEEGDRIIESVADRLINFDPAASRKSGDAKITFGEFLFANVNFGKLDARKALFEEGQERAQTESTDSEQARQIATVEETTVQVEKPKYKSLTQRRVLGPEASAAAKVKVLSTVRVLKTPIDAKVSRNVTVTPLIAEIKKALGKQLDIDFKKEMGGLKDGELRKYLLKNKAAILENMTTTWLMTAMPNAVQKQVNGVWTSDWKGKKIDREKVTTDNAGRTSGAELVRRLPKAATRLSDADFLSNFFTEDGKLIRGRKESLAKAMGEELGIEIIKEALADPNSEIAQAFINSQERAGVEDASNIKVKFDVAAERGNVKFSVGLSTKLQRIGANIRSEFDMQLPKNRDKMINKVLSIHGIDPVHKLNTREDIIAWKEATQKYVLPLLPKWYWFTKKNGEYAESGNSAFRRSARFVGDRSLDGFFIEQINELRALDENSGVFGNVDGISERMTGTYETKLGKTEDQFKQNYQNGTIDAFNEYNTKMHAAFWTNVNKVIRESDFNPDAVRAIGHYLTLVSNDTTHVHKMGAEFVGYTTNAKGKTSSNGRFKLYEMEHAMPATNAYSYLMDAVLNGYDFDAAYNAVMSNYKLIALDAADDLKLKAAGLSNGMPQGWSVLENGWYERYSEAGVDLGTIIMNNGETLADVAGVNKFGVPMSQNGIKFSKSVNQEALEKAIQDIKDIESGQTKVNLSTGLSDKFNRIVERKTGVESFKEFSRIQAQMRGKKKGRFKFFIAPGADDFRGLVHYAFAGQGKQGEKDMAFFEEKLMTPYFKGVAAIDAMRQQIKRDFKAVTQQFRDEYKMLGNTIGDSTFSYDHAIRVYMWDRQGIEVEGLSKRDKKLLLDAIEKNPELVSLADALLVVARRDEWPDPVAHWEGGSVLADLNSMTEKIGRKKFLEEFIANADEIFSEANLNKIEALYGRKHREAIEDSLYAMKNGTNRPSGANRQVNAWLNWINGSTGAIMFFNRRSALLQMLSFTNFINWSDNNPVKAAAAFANQKQYWKDFAMIFNSDKLKERRGGLKQDVSDSELASVANSSKRSPQAILAYLLKIGFTPTQIADSMAIATGGALFYRNRVNTYLKQGLSQKEAEELAFLEFSKKSDEAQQSSDPALVSQEQRSVLGRLVLAFANTPMQYTRLMKKAGLDLINGRGNALEHISKIAYYGAVQNFIFSALQSAMFSLAFDDDDDELTEEEAQKKQYKEEQKVIRVVNSMLDTVLRGSGVYGAIAATIKNTIMEYYKQEEKGFTADHTYTLLAAASISPPIQSKMRKIYSAIQTKKFEKDNVAARGWALTADGKLNLGPNYSILGNVLSGVTNLPLDRVVDELKSISEALDKRNKAWQRIALALGWKTWDVGVRNEEADLIKTTAKEQRKKEGIEKAKRSRAERREKEEAALRAMTPQERLEYYKKKEADRQARAK